MKSPDIVWTFTSAIHIGGVTVGTLGHTTCGGVSLYCYCKGPAQAWSLRGRQTDRYWLPGYGGCLCLPHPFTNCMMTSSPSAVTSLDSQAPQYETIKLRSIYSRRWHQS